MVKIYFPFMKNIDAITLYPFVLFREKNPSQVLINHERIHYEQIKKYGIVKFYSNYLFEYFKNRKLGMSHKNAYLNISYELEAAPRNGLYNVCANILVVTTTTAGRVLFDVNSPNGTPFRADFPGSFASEKSVGVCSLHKLQIGQTIKIDWHYNGTGATITGTQTHNRLQITRIPSK
jgi:hypothetical protein